MGLVSLLFLPLFPVLYPAGGVIVLGAFLGAVAIAEFGLGANGVIQLVLDRVLFPLPRKIVAGAPAEEPPPRTPYFISIPLLIGLFVAAGLLTGLMPQLHFVESAAIMVVVFFLVARYRRKKRARANAPAA